VNVRRVRENVCNELAPLIAASQQEGFEFVVRLVHEQAAGYFGRPGTALFGAYDAELLGVGGLTPDPYTDRPDIGRVRHLYVLPARRAEGVGQVLIGAIIEEARLYYRVLRLRADTQTAATFYQALGFSTTTQPHSTHVLTL